MRVLGLLQGRLFSTGRRRQRRRWYFAALAVGPAPADLSGGRSLRRTHAGACRNRATAGRGDPITAAASAARGRADCELFAAIVPVPWRPGCGLLRRIPFGPQHDRARARSGRVRRHREPPDRRARTRGTSARSLSRLVRASGTLRDIGSDGACPLRWTPWSAARPLRPAIIRWAAYPIPARPRCRRRARNGARLDRRCTARPAADRRSRCASTSSPPAHRCA